MKKLKNGIYEDTWSPGDGVRRYRFFTSPHLGYFTSAGLTTQLGRRNANTWLDGFTAGQAFTSSGRDPRVYLLVDRDRQPRVFENTIDAAVFLHEVGVTSFIVRARGREGVCRTEVKEDVRNLLAHLEDALRPAIGAHVVFGDESDGGTVIGHAPAGQVIVRNLDGREIVEFGSTMFTVCGESAVRVFTGRSK